MKNSAAFENAVSQLFQHWDVLQAAAASQFGGSNSKEKADWLPTVVVDFFARNADLEPSEVECFIAEIMDNEFDLLVEDGSLKTLSKNLCRCFAWARDDRLEELKDYLTSLKPLLPAQPQKVESEDEEESDSQDEADQSNTEETMEVDETQSAGVKGRHSKGGPVVDEDGWTVVVGKKKH